MLCLLFRCALVGSGVRILGLDSVSANATSVNPTANANANANII